MASYLKIFETQSAYEAAESSLILPNVSVTLDNDAVHYNPDPYNGHDYVEIGGVKWATMNIGANSITEYGKYFAWGEDVGYYNTQVGSGEGQKYFAWNTYKWSSDGTSSNISKYNFTDRKETLDLEDDAANIAWGGNWRMPTPQEFETLITSVNTQWVTNYSGSSVNGLLCTDKTDSSKKIFLPAICSAVNGTADFKWCGCYYSNKRASTVGPFESCMAAYYLNFYKI